MLIAAGDPLCRSRYLFESKRKLDGLAGRQGLEPRYAAPEAAVLPLDDLPMGIQPQYNKARRVGRCVSGDQGRCNTRCQKPCFLVRFGVLRGRA
jgi:hypothetical protein